MKKLTLTTLALGLAVTLFASHNVLKSQASNHENHNETTITQEHQDDPTELQFNNLDDLIKIADNVVIGTVKASEQFNEDGAYKFTFVVEDQLKGKAESTIDVYESKGNLELNKKYALFLNYWEHELYENPVYASVGPGAIIEIQNDQLVGDKKFINDLKGKDSLVEKISNSPNVKEHNKKEFNIVKKADSTSSLKDLSKYIVKIVPTEIVTENKNVKAVKVNVLEAFKGQMKNEVTLLLPVEVELNKEYLVFLKDRGNIITLTTQQGSVVSKDDPLWDQIVSELQAK